MTPTKLSKLLIGEVSGVDDPANELRGWLVAKSRGWTAEAAEKRVRAATGATEAPTPAYADCFLWNSGEGDEPRTGSAALSRERTAQSSQIFRRSGRTRSSYSPRS